MRLTHEQALAKLQRTMLEIIDAFSDFCTAHDLPWFLAYGTTLGALRHDGFIPWDDDADVGMLRDDYDRFLAIVAEEGFMPGFSIHNASNTAHFDGVMTKVYRDGTRYLDRRALGEGFDQGIFLDVFPYDRLSADPAAADHQIRGTRFWQNVLYIRGSGDVRVPHRGALGATERVGCALANPVLHLLVSRERALRGFDANVLGPGDAVGDLWAQFPFPHRHPLEVLLPAVPHAFEDRTYPVPADAEAYLTTIYGDWRELPPPENRRTHLPVLIDFGDGDVYEEGDGPADGLAGTVSLRPVAPKVSVIVPTYNTGVYLERATSSVLDQTYGSVELILVDDGSDDGTAEACDRLAERDGRIVAIHQANAGTSAARNAGIEAATGDYLTFLDHDDFWYDPSGLETAMACTASGTVDVVMHQVIRFDDPTRRLDPKGERLGRKREALARRVASEGYAEGLLDITRAGLMVRAAWAKVVRADLVREHGLLFPVGRRNEDTDWSASVFESARSLRWCPVSFGAYRMGHGTAQTAKPVTDAIVDGLAEIVDRHGTVALGEADGALRRALLAYLAYPYVVWLGQADALGRGAGDPTFESMRRWAGPLFGAADDPNVKLAALCFGLFGLDATARALGLAYRRLHPVQGAS